MIITYFIKLPFYLRVPDQYSIRIDNVDLFFINHFEGKQVNLPGLHIEPGAKVSIIGATDNIVLRIKTSPEIEIDWPSIECELKIECQELQKDEEINNKIEIYEDKVREALNKFLEAYRSFTKEIINIDIIDKYSRASFRPTKVLVEKVNENRFMKFDNRFGFVSGTLAKNELSVIRKKLSANVVNNPIYSDLLFLTRINLIKETWREVIINSITAFDSFLDKIIKKNFSNVTIGKKSYCQVIKPTLGKKLKFYKQSTGKDFYEAPVIANSGLKDSVELRNNILHNDILVVTRNQAYESYNAVKLSIDFLMKKFSDPFV